MKTTDLFTKAESEKGRPMQIILPNGKKTEETLTVLGADSETFGVELAKNRKAQLELIDEKEKLSPGEYSKRENALQRDLISSLVIGWTFEEAFSRDAVKVLFENAPYVMSQVDTFAARRSNFFTYPSKG